MRTRLYVTLAVLMLSLPAVAKDKHIYETGELTDMNAVNCGYQEKSGKGFTGVLLGTDSGHKNVSQTLCQEYTLKSDRVVYRIRPRKDHTELVIVGQTAQFRIKKDRLILRLPDSDKEREFDVVSMSAAPATQAATGAQ